MVRDAESFDELTRRGWAVEIVWACQTDEASLAKLVERIRTRYP